jgi:hypothetical protein
MNVFPKGDLSSSEGMLKWFTQIQWAIKRREREETKTHSSRLT